MSAQFSQCERVWFNVRIATCDPLVGSPYGTLEGHLLGVGQGTIRVVASCAGENLSGFEGELIDGQGGWLTPGLIDCHTHLVYGGHRAVEFERRLKGESYQEIARSGGGIHATVWSTGVLSEEELIGQALPRLKALADEGVTCIEIKSGYGLTLDHELRMLRMARRLAEQVSVRVRTTLLAHLIPPEYRERPDAYVNLFCRELIPQVAREGLAEAVDVFCEGMAFSPEQAEAILAAARACGLGLKVHGEQLSNSGAAVLAARYGAWSADHLEYLDETGVRAMLAAGTVATLLPGAFYFLGETQKPPVELLRQYGVPMALATDLNPGTSPLASLRLMMNMGCILFGLTPEEALLAVTRNAAMALGLGDTLGTLSVGRKADMLLWDIDHPAQLAAEVGWGVPKQRIFEGEVHYAPGS